MFRNGANSMLVERKQWKVHPGGGPAVGSNLTACVCPVKLLNA